MLNNQQKEKLKNNWANADSMECMAEVRVYDPLSFWECYIYAMNPEDEDIIACIIKGFTLEVCVWSMSELEKNFNRDGEFLEVDIEYRPRRALDVFKRLQGITIYASE